MDDESYRAERGRCGVIQNNLGVETQYEERLKLVL